MQEPYESIYQELRTAIDGCQRGKADSLAAIECCFQIAYSYWALLAGTQAEETDAAIELNKRIKPRFLAEMRYFELCYYATVFRPSGSLLDRKEFWIRESNRFGRYIEEHQDLYAYYTEGATHRDSDFFASDSVDADRYVRVIADFLALDRYERYLESTFNTFLEI